MAFRNLAPPALSAPTRHGPNGADDSEIFVRVKLEKKVTLSQLCGEKPAAPKTQKTEPMKPILRPLFRPALLLGIALLSSAPALAQKPAPGETVPLDSSVRVGQLPNGITYYLKHNDKPANRADFHIYYKVGAIQEEDSQNGLAHFLEHMAFNGSDHFPDNSMIDWLSTVGVRFGENLNAATGQEQTTYMITNVPLTRPGIDLIVNVVDATIPQRSLYLTTQLAELAIPMLIALNMSDDAARKGLKYDLPKLEQYFGSPVVPTVGCKTGGVRPLLEKLAGVEQWAAPTGKGRFVFDDQKFFRSLESHYKNGRAFSAKQLAALEKLAAKYGVKQ